MPKRIFPNHHILDYMQRRAAKGGWCRREYPEAYCDIRVIASHTRRSFTYYIKGVQVGIAEFNAFIVNHLDMECETAYGEHY